MNFIKPVFKCDAAIDKATFSSSKCLLTISVGQEVHEGDKFASTIELVNASFKSCILLIDDSLQRHSMALNQNKSAAACFDASLLAGDLWLTRNKKHYQKLTILEHIIRWDQWLHHPHYFKHQSRIHEAMTDPTFRSCVDKTVNAFLSRYYRRLIEPKETFEFKRARQLCLDYVVEECAAFCLWPETGCHFEIYPSARSLAMDATHQHFILPEHPDLLHAVGIKFKNRRQFLPQQFEPLDQNVFTQRLRHKAHA